MKNSRSLGEMNRDAIVPQPVGQLDDAPPEIVLNLPWGHNSVLIEKIKDPNTRLWYAAKAIEHGWSRAVLTVQIESGLYDSTPNQTHD